MPVIELPSGQLIDTEGLSSEQVTSALQQLQEQNPDLFAEQPTQSEIDLATATREEIAEYARQRRLAAGVPTAGDLKEPDVDYTTGLQDFGIRAKLGSLELDEEKALYLTDKVGTEGFRQDQGGRFILTQQGRQALGLGEGKELAIDEEGVSRYDVADFAGEAGAPLAVGIGAGLLMSGTGFLVAGPVVGTAMGLAQLAEEAYEQSQGYQRQSREEVFNDAIKEFGFGIFGEGLGRVISSSIGRLIKGPGGKEAEATRAQARQLLREGFRPTVEGAAPGLRPILNRMQAIYEGVFPNNKAADENLRVLIREMDALGTVDKGAIDRLQQIVKADIDAMYSTTDDIARNAQRALDGEIEADIKAIIEPLRKGEKLSDESIQTLVNAKRVFDEQSDSLFTAATRKLGEGNRIIPVAGIKKELDRIARTSPEAGQLRDSQLYQIINGAIARVKAKASERGFPTMSDDVAVGFAYLTPEEGHIIRQIIRNMGYSDTFKASVSGGNQAAVKAAIDDAFLTGEKNLNQVIAYMNRTLPRGQPGEVAELSAAQTDELSELLNKSGMEFSTPPTTATIEQLRAGLNLLQRSRDYYEKGMRRFGDPIVEKLYKETQQGRITVDATKFLDELIENNSPERLLRYFRAVRGTPVIEGLEAGEATLARAAIKKPGGGNFASLDEAREFVSRLPENSTKRSILKQIQQAEKKQATLAAARGQGAQAQEAARQTLARAWLQRELDNPLNYTTKQGVEVIDGIKLARKIEELGKTKNVLFKGELDDLNRLTTLMKQTGAEIDPNVLSQFADDNIANAIRAARDALAQKQAFREDSFLQSLLRNDSEGIVSSVFQRGNASRVRQFMSGRMTLKDEAGNQITQEISQEARDNVQTAAMERIVRSLGDVDSPAFRDAFISGRLGSNLQSTLNGYGRETLEAMFGSQTTDDLFKLADNMVAVSNAPLAGKGGLAAPNIALGLGIYGMVTAPLATLPAAAFYMFASRALRSPTMMKIMLASREPGGDAIGQAFQFAYTTSAQINQQLSRAEEGPINVVPPEAKQAVAQQAADFSEFAQQQVPQIASAAAGTAAQVSPILLPDPATQALAQSLGRTRP